MANKLLCKITYFFFFLTIFFFFIGDDRDLPKKWKSMGAHACERTMGKFTSKFDGLPKSNDTTTQSTELSQLMSTATTNISKHTDLTESGIVLPMSNMGTIQTINILHSNDFSPSIDLLRSIDDTQSLDMSQSMHWSRSMDRSQFIDLSQAIGI